MWRASWTSSRRPRRSPRSRRNCKPSTLGGVRATPSVCSTARRRRDVSYRCSQHRLAAAEFEGASADGSVTFKMNGQQQPVSAAAPGFDGKSAEDLSKAFSEAMADAQAKSLAAMNEKMQALYASVGLGGAGM